MKISKIACFQRSVVSSVATGGAGAHWGSDAEGWATVGWGATARWGGGGNREGGQQWGCRQPLRTALRNISISLQNSLT